MRQWKIPAFLEALGWTWSLIARIWRWLTSGGVGVVSVWLASTNEFMQANGPFSYWVAFLFGSLIAAWLLAAVTNITVAVGRSKYFAQLKAPDSYIDPLADTYTRKRIRLSELVADPFSKVIENKTFVHCELVGPDNIVVESGQLGIMTTTACDFIELRGDIPTIGTNSCIILRDCTFRDCNFIRLSIFCHKDTAIKIRQLNPNIFWLTSPPE